MTFPADIKGCMKDCILALIWPRETIVQFFKQHGCSRSELASVREFKENNFSRAKIVDTVFAKLDSRTDGALGPYRSMLQSLLEWEHFDPYYFDQLKKLDRNVANKALRHLRQLQEIRDARIKSDRAARADRDAKAQSPGMSLEEIKKEFLSLHGGLLPVQRRGYALEAILTGLGKLSALEVTEAFRVSGEQIDGAVKYDGEHYLIEAKWQEAAASNEAVYQFVGKIEGKMYGRGLFFSVQGFSAPVVQAIAKGKALKTIFVDGEDLILVLEGQLTFRALIDRKVKAAQTKGDIYMHPITGKAKT